MTQYSFALHNKRNILPNITFEKKQRKTCLSISSSERTNNKDFPILLQATKQPKHVFPNATSYQKREKTTSHQKKEKHVQDFFVQQTPGKNAILFRTSRQSNIQSHLVFETWWPYIWNLIEPYLFKMCLSFDVGGHTMQVTTYWADVMSRNFELMSCPVNNNNNTVKWAMISCRLPIFKVTVMSCGRYRLLMFRPKF